MAGKCPGCGAFITNVRIEGVDAASSGGPTWRGLAYCCPYCSTIISVQIDPIAIKADIVKELKR